MTSAPMLPPPKDTVVPTLCVTVPVTWVNELPRKTAGVDVAPASTFPNTVVPLQE